MAIVDGFGRPYKSAAAGLPDVHRQAPPLTIQGKLQEKEQFEAVVALHYYGFFQNSAWLVSQMMTASPVSSGMQTRCDALTGTKVQFLPGKNNDKGRRAARDCEEEDWNLMCPATARAQIHRGGLFSGAQLAQKHWYTSPSSGRAIPRVEPYHNMWVQWDNTLCAYRVFTWLDGWRIVPSPSLLAPGETWTAPGGSQSLTPDDQRLWIAYEPFGGNSFRDDQALLFSLWEPYFGYALANNDMNAVCEQQGRGQSTLEFPSTSENEKPKRDEYIAKILSIGSNGVFPLEQFYDDNGEKKGGYKLAPYVWPATGYQIVAGTKESNEAAITGRILGHNTQGKTVGSAGSGGGAATGLKVRGDILVGDTLREFSWTYPQLLRDWAAVNYGDPGLAPIPIYTIDDPMADVAAAQTVQFTSAALDTLRRHGVDTVELVRRFQMPVRQEAQQPGFQPEPPPTKGGPSPSETATP